jgi:predicted phage terminase large subunit-like protein
MPNWHIDAIAEHLEAVTIGEIRNLVINIPPRFMKSLLVSVFWPTWVWINLPSIQWLFASYAEDLAFRDSLKCRRLILSPWYHGNWGDNYRIRGDQNQKSKYENDKGGHRIAVGLGGGVTGEGGDILVLDDPVKAKDADSDSVLKAACTFLDATLSTRGNNPKTVRKVIVMQRLSQKDPTGHILEKMRKGEEAWAHLCLPMEYEKQTYVTGLDWEDPRQEEGELLWPSRFGAKEVALLKQSLGARGAAGQLQQRPAPAGGMTFLKAWWLKQNRYHHGKNECVSRWVSVDTAMKDEDENAYSAASIWEMLPDYRIALVDVWKDKVQFPELITQLERISLKANRDDKLAGVVIEDRVSGISAVQTLRAQSPQWLSERVIAFAVGGRGKLYRAKQASSWCERGAVLLPYPSETAPWLFDFEAELFNFPGSRYKDQVDTFSQAIIYLEWYLSSWWQGMMTA